MKKITVLLSFFMPGIFLFSQSNNQLKGVVKTIAHYEAAYATIMIKSYPDSSLVKAEISQLDGSFTIENIAPGTYFIEVTYIGFENYSSGLFELSDQEQIILPTIFLQEKTEELHEVVVTAAKPIIEIKPDKTVFNVDGNINATGSNALELLRKAPGVVVDNNEKIILMGKSGVKIYIDGKPSQLGTDDLAAYLKSMQSEEIESFEIIINPSAKYDAAGNAGIINIRIKKDKNLGFNANLSSSYSIGTYAKYNNALNFNYRNEDVNIFGQYGNSTGNWKNYNLIYREQAGMAFDQSAQMRGDYLNHRFRLGADYKFGYKSTIGVLLNGYHNDGTFHNNSVVDISSLVDDQTMSMLYASNDIDQKRNNLTINLNYAYNDGMGTTLNLDGDYGRFHNDGSSLQPNTYMNASGSEILQKRVFASNTPTTIDIYTFKVDFEKSLWGGKITAGAKFTSVSTDNTYDFFEVVEQVRILNLDRSNNFDYLENVSAGYLSFQKQINKWNVSVGLRTESTHSDGVLSSAKFIRTNRVEQDYWDWFPSGGLTYQMNDQHSFRLNYSRRLERPSYQDLNPFEFKLDELTFVKGNAFLNPQYANSYSLTHTFRSKLNTTLSYSVTNDLITRITDTLNQTASFITYVNLDKQKVTSLALSYPFTIVKWWNVFANLSAFHTENKANFAPGKFIDVSATGANLYTQNTFSLPKDFKLELSGFYQSPFIWEGNFEFDAMYNVDFGIRKNFLKDRGSVKIAVTDIFKTNKVHGYSELGALKMTVWSGWESRQLRVNLTYKLGNQQVSNVRRRKTGIEDEQKRIKTDDQN